MYEPFIFKVFDYMRRNGAPIGVSDYLLAVKVLRSGLGLEDVESLKRICSLIFVKSMEDRTALEEVFKEQVMPALSPKESKKREKEERTGKASEPYALQEETLDVDQVVYKTKSKSVADGLQGGKLAEPLARQSPRIAYHLTHRLPLNRREMAAVFRHLRLLKRSGPPEDLDVTGTIMDICRTGFLLTPVLEPRRRNLVELVMLIDTQGSMSPFCLFTDALRESIEKSGLPGRVRTYYFHDCPEESLYESPALTNPSAVSEVLSFQSSTTSSVLIISDGGAARGYFDEDRLKETLAFIEELRQRTYRYAWLNPVPYERWKGSTAWYIAREVPMFPVNRDGLYDVVQLLRGYPQVGGKR